LDICVKITTLLLHREEFNIPTPEEELEYLKEYLARPDAVARMEQWAPVFDALAKESNLDMKLSEGIEVVRVFTRSLQI